LRTIFIFIPWFDPSFKAGGPVQSLINLVRNYNENIAYYIFTGDKDIDGTKIKVTEKNKWVLYNKYTQVWYSNSNNIYLGIKTELIKIKPDIVFINGVYSLKFNILPLLFLNNYKIILSSRGMLHPGALSQKKIKKKIFLSFLKILRVQKKISFHSTDEFEKTCIEKTFGKKANVFVAANFPKKIMYSEVVEKEVDKLIAITVALVSPMKNYDLIIQSLNQSKANIIYHIIGGIKDKSYWSHCQYLISQLPENISVVYHGEQKPDQINSFLKKAHVFIMPSESENYGHALIEAMQSGLPIITSKHTPWNYLYENKSGVNTELSVPSLTTAINMFSQMNQLTLSEWSRAASDYAQKAIDLHRIYSDYALMFGINN